MTERLARFLSILLSNRTRQSRHCQMFLALSCYRRELIAWRASLSLKVTMSPFLPCAISRRLGLSLTLCQIFLDETLVKNSKLLNSAGLSHFFMAEYKGKKVLQKVIKYRNIDDKVIGCCRALLWQNASDSSFLHRFWRHSRRKLPFSARFRTPILSHLLAPRRHRQTCLCFLNGWRE